jgi:LysR family transcriptional regulator (chromosome initiation inhibitor)
MASPVYRARWFGDGITRETIRRAPVLVFNRKDRLQADFILQHFGLADDAYPCHFLPASEGFLNAARLGLGWGMLPEVMLAQWCQPGELVDLFPERPVDVPLYWHAWKVQPPRLAQLSNVLVAAARQVLR